MSLRKALAAIAGLIVLLLIAVGSLLPIRSTTCGESAVYRVAWGLYACEYNAEAGADFYCQAKIGGWRDYLTLRELTQAECRRRQELYFVPWIYRVRAKHRLP